MKKALLILSIFLSYASFACDTSPVITVGSPSDNGNGTFDIVLDVCIGDGGSAAGFSTDLTGVNIIGFTPPSLTSSNTNVATGALAGGILTYSYPGGTGPANMFVDEFDADCFNYTITVDGDPDGETITFIGVNSTHVGSCAFLGGNTQVINVPPPPSTGTCGETVYDPGGTGNYGNSQTVSTLICPQFPGDQVTLNFSAFNLESGWDFLTIYDGPTTGSPSLGTFTGTTVPGPFTSTDPSGCITILFDSDGSVTRPGFELTVDCNFILSAEIKNLNIECDNQEQLLKWSSLREINNDYFLIEKSSDGINWGFLDKLDGAGNSVEIINYVYRVIGSAGQSESYFRLSQVDFDGTSKELGIISSIDCNEDQLEVYPNPNNGSFNIKSSEGIARIEVLNTMGIRVFETAPELIASFASLELLLENGIYILNVETKGKKVISKRFVVNR